jgi:hypothetical protein
VHDYASTTNCSIIMPGKILEQGTNAWRLKLVLWIQNAIMNEIKPEDDKFQRYMVANPLDEISFS